MLPLDRRARPRLDSPGRRVTDLPGLLARMNRDALRLALALRSVESSLADVRAGRIPDDGMSFRFERRRNALCAHLYRLTLLGTPELRKV